MRKSCEENGVAYTLSICNKYPPLLYAINHVSRCVLGFATLRRFSSSQTVASKERMRQRKKRGSGFASVQVPSAVHTNHQVVFDSPSCLSHDILTLLPFSLSFCLSYFYNTFTLYCFLLSYYGQLCLTIIYYSFWFTVMYDLRLNSVKPLSYTSHVPLCIFI